MPVKPSLMQTLLRQPSQSYQSTSASPYDPAAPSASGSRASSLHRGAEGSLRSAQSYGSSTGTGSAWTADGQWDWSQFGSRKGLTGGAASLHPSEVASQLGVARPGYRVSSRRTSDAGSIRTESVHSGYDDDRRSMRSSKSYSSMRSAASSMGPNAVNWTKDLGGSLVQGVPGVTKRTSRRYSDAGRYNSNNHDAASFVSSSASTYYGNSRTGPDPSSLSTSRRYSSAAGTTTITTSGYQVMTTTEYARKKISKSKRSLSAYDPSLLGDERPPSLTSSQSSAPSSPPVTPLHSTHPLAFPPPFQIHKGSKDAMKKEKKKHRLDRDLSIEEAVRRAGLPQVIEVEEEPLTPAAAVKRKASLKKDLTQAVVMQKQEIEHGQKVEEEVKPALSGPNETLDASKDQSMMESLKAPSASSTTPSTSAPPTPDDEIAAPVARFYTVDEFFAVAAVKDPVVNAVPTVTEVKTDDTDSEILLPEATSTAPTAAVEVPRLCLTRSESDQLVSGVKGDVDIDEENMPSSTAGSGRVSRQSSPHRSASEPALATPADSTTIQVVATSKPTKTSSTAASAASSIRSNSPSSHVVGAESDASSIASTTAAQDQPQWLKRIKALGDPIAPLVEPPKLKVKPPALHWTVKHHYEQQQQLRAEQERVRRPSSSSNLRRPKSIMTPMPEEREEDEVVPPLPVARPEPTHRKPAPASPPRSFPSWVKDKDGFRKNSAQAAATHAPAQTYHVLAPRPASMFVPTSSSYDSAQRHARPSSVNEGVLSTISTPTTSRPGSPTRSESSHHTDKASLVRSTSLARSASHDGPHTFPTSPTPKRAASLMSRQNSNSSMIDFTPLPFPFLNHSPERGTQRQRASSSYSEAGSDAEDDTQSISGFSTMSMPVAGAHTRPPKNPRREFITASNRDSLVATPADLEVMCQTASLMTAVSVSAVAALSTQTKGYSSSSGWSLFRKAAPPLASTASQRRFDPLRDLTVSSMQPLPKKIKSDEVLVEVFAVPVERADVERTKQMTNQVDGFGWIPGRGFYGKIIDTGIEVTKLRQGELVWGIQPMKKSGALAELITVHKSHLAPAPHCDLTVEQVATLPIAGTSSLQVMELLCSSLPRGSKILILDAHIGVGNLCLQLARHLRPARDLYLVAHCPPEFREDHVFCRESGASDVLIDEPLAAINRLHEAEFDVVIDTIGGRRIYDASRRVLHHSGSYITTVGDSSTTLPTSSAQFKNSIRSLRRSFFRKDRKHINYWFASLELDERESPRELLDRLRPVVEDGGVLPRLGRRYLMKEAFSAFGGRAALEGGSVVRVKMV